MFRKPQITVALGGQPKVGKNDIPPVPVEINWTKIQETSVVAGKVMIGSYAAKKLIDTACQIAVIAAKSSLK